jgi:undecaprenyl diphosphate synthase
MQHLAIIPDGNRRWAMQNKLASLLGHQRGAEGFKTTLRFCLKQGIPYVSFYTFSLENFRRSESESNALFSMLQQLMLENLEDFLRNNIRVKFIGDRTVFPAMLKADIEHIEQATSACSAVTVNLLFCYGGTAEITYATKQIAQQVKDGTLAVEDITEETIAKNLWTGDTPVPDVILRTSGVKRLSNYLLYQAAYSELIFLDKFWPEITEADLEQCLEKFHTIKRNFGT